MKRQKKRKKNVPRYVYTNWRRERKKERERERGADLAEEFEDRLASRLLPSPLSEAIARKTRVFHSILLVFGPSDYGKQQSRQGWNGAASENPRLCSA